MLSLILPTFNEAQNIPNLLSEIGRILGDLRYEIIVVDDDSPDGTWRVAEEMASHDPHVRVIRRVGQRGLSSAVIEGFRAARGDVLAVADADGQHDLALLPALYQAVREKGGMAIGSRYVPGGSVGAWDERRRFLSKVATALAIKLCRVEVADPMSGFFAVSRPVFAAVRPQFRPRGFKILLDLLLRVPPSTPVTELPYMFRVRERGESKMSIKVELQFLWSLLVALWQRHFTRSS